MPIVGHLAENRLVIYAEFRPCLTAGRYFVGNNSGVLSQFFLISLLKIPFSKDPSRILGFVIDLTRKIFCDRRNCFVFYFTKKGGERGKKTNF